MRITAGDYKGRKLETPKNDKVRPTSDKVRQAIFNALQSRGAVTDAVVIDAFCGTGALGLEALSQGAAFCHFFDNDKQSYALCKKNIALLGVQTLANPVFQDVTWMKPRPKDMEVATLLFLDPPYRKNLVLPAVKALTEQNWITPEALLVIETAKDEVINDAQIKIENEKIYGDTKIIFASLA
jgi:16S rRNA (guanine966-N2)-methyltransferase